MIKAKLELEKYLEKQFEKIVLDNELYKALCVQANVKYNLPKSIASDLIAGRVSLSEASEFVLFILLDSMKDVWTNNARLLNTNAFYLEKEINYYTKQKYEDGKIKFPLTFKMIQIEEDQWIGKIDAKMLMQLRAAQLINYDVNAQRTMQRIVRGTKTIFKISLNELAVSKIVQSFVKKIFIPNTITLNIPPEAEADFYYDEETCTFIVKSLEHYNITDGYHRYVALCRICDMDNNFNYNMELRIINFAEDKANQFIYQEDQKTKMRKLDSDSMNMDKAANIVVKRLNESASCNLKGLISRNDGIVPAGELAELIHFFYFKGAKKDKERTITIQAVKELTQNFNLLTEYDTKYLEERMEFPTLLSAMCCFNYFKENNLGTDRLCETIETVAQKIKDSDNSRLKLKNIKPKAITTVNKMIEEVL